MSTIRAGTTTTTALVNTADITGNIVLTADSGIVNAATGTTGGLIVPTGTTAQRPASPTNGTIRYNTSNSEFEIYQSSSWVAITIQNTGIYAVNYLVIAGGGGGGGAAWSGGGGAGGYLTSTFSVASGTAYTVTVGAGGAGGASTLVGTDGSNSAFSSIIATGGGGGAIGDGGTPTGRSGGSGGGGTTPGSGTSGQGNAGGSNSSSLFVYPISSLVLLFL
jgi:hypothetical protein